MTQKDTFDSIDSYIAAQPTEVQPKLIQLRETIRTAAPNATEKISYHMPTFAHKGNLVYFATWKNHIGFYGTSHAILQNLADEVAPYATEKGTLQFPLEDPLPLDLIRKIVEMRLAENQAKAK